MHEQQAHAHAHASIHAHKCKQARKQACTHVYAHHACNAEHMHILYTRTHIDMRTSCYKLIILYSIRIINNFYLKTGQHKSITPAKLRICWFIWQPSRPNHIFDDPLFSGFCHSESRLVPTEYTYVRISSFLTFSKGYFCMSAHAWKLKPHAHPHAPFCPHKQHSWTNTYATYINHIKVIHTYWYLLRLSQWHTHLDIYTYAHAFSHTPSLLFFSQGQCDHHSDKPHCK